jgi:oligopeptide transport system substrate-binding protein
MLPHYAWYPIHSPTILKFGAIDDRISRWTRPGNFVGNGAFQFKSWRFKHYLEVERNPHYWDAANVGVNGIRFFPIDNTAAEERMFRDGQLHVTEIIPLDKIATWRDQHPESFFSHTYLSVYFYRINTTRVPRNDKRVRHALSLAIDREGLCRNVMRAGQPPAPNFVPPVAGYEGPPVLRFDPVEARRLLAEAGFPDGRNFPRFDILINVMESHKTIAEAIQQMWKENLNIEVGINSQDWGVYLDSQQRLDYDVCRAAWTGDYADPMTFLDMWTTGNGNNETGWANPRYDAFIEQARRTRDTKERFAILREAESLFLDELPAIPFYFYVRYYLVSPMVSGWHPKLLDNHPWKYLRLNPEAGALN